MPFFEAERRGRTTGYALSSTTSVAALAHLRQQTLPQLIDPPRFFPGARPLTTRPDWLTRLLGHLTRQVVLAGVFAAVVLILATALPAWAALQQSESVAPSVAVHSSVGATGTAATRVEDLGVATFVGRIPFVQQLRYLGALTGGTPPAQRFVEGARQASLAEYVQNVGVQVTLPYVSDAVSTKQAIDTWTAAVAEAERRAALRSATSGAVWQAPPPVAGTRIPGAHATFYSCIGNGFCGTMANGQQVFAGAAACSADLPFGTRFVLANDPAGRVFVCLDRGALAPTWVDVWFYDAYDGWTWQSIVGTRSDIIIVE